MKPGAQEHEYVEDRLMQTPLFTQGFEEQKLLTGTGNTALCVMCTLLISRRISLKEGPGYRM